MFDLLIKNGEVYIDHHFVKTNLAILGEKIAYIGNDLPEAKEVFDSSNKKIIPGLIDPHVHFELWCGTVTSRDDFFSGGKSAALGGVTTIIDFLDPTRNAEELEKSFYERLELAKKCPVDYHFHACIREPNGDLEQYVLKMKQLGMRTVKLFTTYSETHRRTYDKDIIELLKLSKKHEFIVTAHIENDEMVNRDESLKCTDISEARNSEVETSEALKLCKFAAETGGNLYMVHCSSGYTLKKIIEQFGEYLNKNIFIESCPQYFALNKDLLKGDKGYLYTFAPPLRSEEERKLMCVNFDRVFAIGTDHCSFTSEDKKTHPLLKGHPLGIGGIEHSYIVLHKMFGDKVIDKMSENTAKLEKFTDKIGIKIGNSADLAIVEAYDGRVTKPHGNVDYSVYENLPVDQRIDSTILRGKFVVKHGEFIPNIGRLVDCD